MHFFFCDDSKYDKPMRKGMGPLIATGAVAFPANSIKNAEDQINSICKKFRFPEDEEFKWSPSRDLWMYKNLIEDERKDFFLQVIETSKKLGATASVIIEDEKCNCADNKTKRHDIDATNLLIERIGRQLERINSYGVIIADRPSGGRTDEKRFLNNCLETIQKGTAFVKPKHIALNVLTSPSHLIRLLQVADLVVSCTTAMVAGNPYSQEVFEHILPMLDKDRGRVGGIGLKIHPDIKYVNLYYWICGDKEFFRQSTKYVLPISRNNYYKNDGINS